MFSRRRIKRRTERVVDEHLETIRETKKLMRQGRLKKIKYKCNLCGRETYVNTHYPDSYPKEQRELMICIFCREAKRRTVNEE